MDGKRIEELAEYCLNCKVKPCQTGCPLENDIPEFIKNVKEKNYEQAYEVLRMLLGIYESSNLNKEISFSKQEGE